MRNWLLSHAARWALVFGRRERALALYSRILESAPDDVRTLACVAFLHAEAGERAQAIAGFERAVALAPGDADNWFNLGFLRQQEGAHDVAIAAFRRAVALDARHDRAWFGLALSLLAQGRHAEAIAPLEANCELQPLSPHGHMELARAHFALGERERCEKQMRRLRAFDPKSAAQLEDETGIAIGVERWWLR